jgi:hypothetical protein
LCHWVISNKHHTLIHQSITPSIQHPSNPKIHYSIYPIRHIFGKEETMRIVVTGGTGFIGTPLCRYLKDAGHQVIVLTRSRQAAEKKLGPGYELVEWKPPASGEWEAAIDGVYGVVNLAGENIGARRWTNKRKQEIIGSRLAATGAIVAAIGKAKKKPKLLLNASAIGYYGPRGDEEVTEKSSPGHDFLATTTAQWEDEAQKVQTHGTRLVLLRNGLVLGKDGGALPRMLLPFRLFVGGPIGSGRQWMSWIHRDDVLGLIFMAMQNDAVRGVINATAPNPATMKEFCKTLGKAMSRPSWLPVPGFALKILLGEMSMLVLTGQKVAPKQAEHYGYQFQYPELEAALRSIVG